MSWSLPFVTSMRLLYGTPGRDDSTSHDGLAGPRRGDQNAELVGEELRHSILLQRRQGASKGKGARLGSLSRIGDCQLASGTADDLRQRAEHSPRQMYPSEILLVALDEARCAECGEPQALPLVKKRVVQRGKMFDLGKQPGRKP